MRGGKGQKRRIERSEGEGRREVKGREGEE